MNHRPPLPPPPEHETPRQPYYADRDFDPLIGRTVIFVEHLQAPDRDSTIALYLDNGKAFEFRLEEDCCSTSAFTNEAFEEAFMLIGAEVKYVEHREGGSTGYRRGEDKPVGERTAALSLQYPPSESDSWHFIVFATDKGHVTLDWRNMSNGHYDGSCAVVEIAPLPAPAHDAALERRLDIVRQVLDAVRRETDDAAVAAEVARGKT